MKAHIYTPKATPGVELGAGALFFGEPTEENKICDVSAGADIRTRQDETGLFTYTEQKIDENISVITPFKLTVNGKEVQQ